MEDSIKRPDGSLPKEKFDKSANVKNELDGIFAQIGQVNGIVKQIEEEKKVELHNNVSTTEQESINFGSSAKQLPRWAQSMVGEGPEPRASQAQANLQNESMENIFEQNLRQLSTVEVEMQESKASGKYKIDLLDNNDEDELDEP